MKRTAGRPRLYARSAEARVELRRRRAAGETSAALGREFGISAGRVRSICGRKPDSWRWVEADGVDGVPGEVSGRLGGAQGPEDVPGEIRDRDGNRS